MNIVVHHAQSRYANSVVASTTRFRKFVNVLTKESKKPELNTFRWGQGSTISDVHREANAALEAYEERGNSLKKHFFRTAGRNFSNNASSVEVLLEFLPSGEFTSILCGALTLVFRVRGQSPSLPQTWKLIICQAASRTAKVREQVFNCLGALTRTVEGTKGLRKLYSGNKRLWETAESLYIALLDAVQDIIAWLDDGAWSRTLSVFKQEDYGRPLEDKIKHAVETKVKEFHEQLEFCQHERTQQIHIGVDGITRCVDSLQNEVQKIQVVQEAHREDVTQQFMFLLEGLVRNFDWQRRTVQEQREALDRLTQKMHDPMVLVVRSPPMISSTQLLDLLQIATSLPEDDLQVAAQYGQTLPPERQARAASLLQNVQFQSWLKAGRCEILVVNGKDPRSHSGTMSSLSYIVGLLGRVFTATQTAVPLVCVCGRHASPGDPLEGAAGVLRLLVFQLLSHVGDSADLTLLDFDFIEAVKSGDIEYLCELFRSLIVSVINVAKTPCAIVCLVDGVSFLETASRRPGLEILIAFLQQLVLDIDELGGLLIFKVLLTYPYTSSYAHDWFLPENILTMCEETGGDRHGYNLVRLTSASEELVLGPPNLHRHASEP